MRGLSWTLAVAVVLPAPAAVAAENVLWKGYGYDNQLRNAVPSKRLTARTAPRLRPAWRIALDGAVIASPLAARVGGRQLVFASTAAGSVYAVTAAAGRVVWRRGFGTVSTPFGACGTYGINSTGAVDVERGLLYVIGADGWLRALSLATGVDAPGWPLRIVTRTSYEYVYGGLRIAGDRLYVPVASYCDQPDPGGTAAEGRLLAIPLSDPHAPPAVFDPVPGVDNLGGIWGWGGVSLEPDGSFVYTGVGNSRVFSAGCGCFVDDAGFGDSLVKLAPDLSRVVASNNPRLPATGDYDFGAAPVIFRPRGCPPLAAANGKIGSLFVWDRTRIEAGPLDVRALSTGISAFVGAPSWSSRLGLLFEAQVHLERGGRTLGDGVEAFRFTADCRLRPVWSAGLGSGNQPTPLIVGDVVVAGGGNDGDWFVRAARSGRALRRLSSGGAATVAAVISVGGALFAGDLDGRLHAFRVG